VETRLDSMFSVIVPVYNHEAFLGHAVRSALRSPLVAEVLLLDDGSRDGSAKLAERLAAAEPRVLNLTPPDRKNRGAPCRLNELVGAATRDWIAVLNSDDVFVAGRFEAVVSDPLFPQSDFIFGNLLLMNESGALIGAKRGPFDTSTPFPPSFDVPAMVEDAQLLDLLSHQNYLGTTSNMIFRKDLHTRIGGFGNHRYVHDWDFALRAMAVRRPLYIQRFITAYRFHGRNTISENAAAVDLESANVFSRFVVEFPEVATRPNFRTGLRSNVNAGLLMASVAKA
jgi:glycosyltransferase involved in cell wall biosynthesis